MIVAGVPVPAALAGFICRWSLPPVVSGCPDEGDRGDVFPATPLWYAAREPGRTIHPSRLWPLLVLLAAIGTAGCASTVALDRAVVAYDTTTADSVAKQLLLNIARARHNLPIHFTAVSSIAATYRYSFTAGAGPALTGDRGWLLVPVIGGSAEENPTISIAPMQGEEFTQRLLTPFSGAAADAAPAARLRCRCAVAADGAEVRLETGDARRVTLHTNRPSDREAYTVFRRMVAHLSAIQDEHALRVEPLHFQYNWTVPAESVTPENFESIYEGFSLTLDADARTYRVSRRINGRVVSTNYDPDVLPNDERHRLQRTGRVGAVQRRVD